MIMVVDVLVGALESFLLYVGVGTTGASLYLLLMLITDQDLTVLKNNVVKDISIMIVLYVLAGGLFASLVQLSTGTLFAISNLQTVLILGFGWQGALSGVGSAKKVTSARDDAQQSAMQVASTIAQSKEAEAQAMTAYYQKKLADAGLA